MRKALIGILLAAAAATPAFAQDNGRQQRWQQRFEQNQARNQQRSEVRTERQETRQEVREVRREQRQVVRQQRQPRQDGAAGIAEAARIRIEQQQQIQAQQQQAAAAAAAQQGQGRQGRLERRENRLERREDRIDRRQDRVENRQDRQGQRGYPDGWNNVDPNDARAVRARDRYLELERRNRQDARQDRREDRRDYRADRRWDRNQWRNDRRYDWYSYRNNYRDLYRVGRYYDPYGAGYGYQRFSIGIRIGSPFYSSRYHISDPWQYRLPDAGPGYTWVRYYNDVLLIDTYSGEVVDVIHDFFW